MRKNSNLADIEYVGSPGITAHCIDAVQRMILYGDSISRALILTSSSSHNLLLTTDLGRRIAVKSGFGSGYLGEGSRGFSHVLNLLDCHGADIEEADVARSIFVRLDTSSLTVDDLNVLDSIDAIRPVRWREYVHEQDWTAKRSVRTWRRFPCTIPLRIVDDHVFDLAKDFWSDPDASLISAYRRFEDLIRTMTGQRGSGRRLFSDVFLKANPLVTWPDIDPAEHTARANLIISVFGAHRNPRAHTELSDDEAGHLSEFLALNHIFRLMRGARVRDEDCSSDQA
jgi:hypothetical protein